MEAKREQPLLGSDRALAGLGPMLLLVAIVTALRLLSLWLVVPYDLVQDEAHYWLWSQHPGWSYYSKGPGIAWAIWLGTAAFGDTVFGVRWLAPVAGAIGAICVGLLAKWASGDRRAAVYGAAVFMLLPATQATTLFMTIDGPYIACWALACLCAWRALRTGSASAWGATGLAIAAGFLFKYTMLLFIPGLLVFLLLDRRARAALRLGPVLIGVACASLGLIPVLIWNSQNGWATVLHLMGHLRLEGGDIPAERLERAEPYSPLWTLEYLGLQILVAGPALALAAIGFGYALKKRRSKPVLWRAQLYCWSIGLSQILFYFVVSFFTPTQGNWTLAAYVTLSASAGMWLPVAMRRYRWRVRMWKALPEPRPRAGMLRRSPETHSQALWHWTIGVGIFVGLSLQYLPAYRLLPFVGDRLPLGRLERGPVLAEGVQERLEELRAQDNPAGPPVVMTGHYGTSSLLSWLLPGRPVVHAASAQFPSVPEEGLFPGRKSQLDFWPEWSLDEQTPALIGRDAVIVGGGYEQWKPAFDRVEGLPGNDRRDRPTFIGYGFRGFGQELPRDASGGERE
ncbi:MAG: phospholipid carrier-dependent glycosyltransferase [Phycisphaerales bacterium]|nr:MAG: phospholipid carrier-dependent glycosyltransferase [Phycisphaerales bacterium]